MRSLYPTSLIACIRDGRAPTAEEISSVGQKLWAEGVVFMAAGRREVADTFARAALWGCEKQRMARLVYRGRTGVAEDGEH